MRRPLYLGARSAGMAGGRKGGLGFTLSTIGSSTTRVSSLPGQLDCGPDRGKSFNFPLMFKGTTE
jgi:hypothetical protein